MNSPLRPLAFVLAVAASTSLAAQRQAVTPAIRDFVSVDAPVVALTHVRVIDGTGAPPRDDQTIVMRDGVIETIGPAARRRSISRDAA